eukprot:gene7071-1266_t
MPRWPPHGTLHKENVSHEQNVFIQFLQEKLETSNEELERKQGEVEALTAELTAERDRVQDLHKVEAAQESAHSQALVQADSQVDNSYLAIHPRRPSLAAPPVAESTHQLSYIRSVLESLTDFSAISPAKPAPLAISGADTIHEFRSAVRYLQTASIDMVTPKEPAALVLVQALEKVLIHGTAKGATYWNYVEHSEHCMKDPVCIDGMHNLQATEQVSNIPSKAPKGVENNSNNWQGRLWLLYSLQTHSLFDALRSLHRQPDIVSAYYEPHAIMRNRNSFLLFGGWLVQLQDHKFAFSEFDLMCASDYKALRMTPSTAISQAWHQNVVSFCISAFSEPAFLVHNASCCPWTPFSAKPDMSQLPLVMHSDATVALPEDNQPIVAAHAAKKKKKKPQRKTADVLDADSSCHSPVSSALASPTAASPDDSLISADRTPADLAQSLSPTNSPARPVDSSRTPAPSLNGLDFDPALLQQLASAVVQWQAKANRLEGVLRSLSAYAQQVHGQLEDSTLENRELVLKLEQKEMATARLTRTHRAHENAAKEVRTQLLNETRDPNKWGSSLRTLVQWTSPVPALLEQAEYNADLESEYHDNCNMLERLQKKNSDVVLALHRERRLRKEQFYRMKQVVSCLQQQIKTSQAEVDQDSGSPLAEKSIKKLAISPPADSLDEIISWVSSNQQNGSAGPPQPAIQPVSSVFSSFSAPDPVLKELERIENSITSGNKVVENGLSPEISTDRITQLADEVQSLQERYFYSVANAVKLQLLVDNNRAATLSADEL